MRRRTLVLIAVLVLIAAGVSLGFYWSFSNNSRELQLAGVVEVHELQLGSKIGGRVEKMYVQEGEEVEAGKELLRFETPELDAQRAQVAEKLAAARAELAKARAGPRPQEKDEARAAMEAARARRDRMFKGWRKEEKEQAEADLAAAKSELNLAQKNFERMEKLDFQVSPTEYDAAVGRLKTAKERYSSTLARKQMIVDAGNREEDKRDAQAQYQQALAHHNLLQAGTREEDKDLAYAQMKELENRLRELDANLAEAVVHAPSKLVVEVLAVRKGDLVAPNQPVIRALQAEERWVKVFVPATQLGRIKVGDAVEVTCDSYPGKRFPGTIIQVATIGEFTPRNVQTLDERRHQVFGVKVRVDDGGEVFKAGMAAEVFVKLN